MIATEQDGREAVDMLRADMAEHQRRHTRMLPTDDANAKLASELVTEIANRAAESKPELAAAEPARGPVARTVSDREVGGERYLLEHGLDAPDPIKPATEAQRWFMPRALARINYLLSLPESGLRGAPSWATRVKAVMAIKNKANAWLAAAANPGELLRSRHELARDQSTMKRMGLETISQLTPKFARHKAAQLNKQYLAEFCQLLEDSNVIGVGDWKAFQLTKVFASG